MKLENKTIDKIVYSLSAFIISLIFHFQFPEFISKVDATNRFVVSNILIYQGIHFLVFPTLTYILILIWKPFKKRYIELITIVYLTITVFIISFPIAYQILNLGKELAKIPTVQIGSSNGWLSFIGSIFGGLITLIALIFTLNHQNRTREEIERASLFPVVVLEAYDFNEEYSFPINTPIKFSLKAIGDNHIKNLSLQWDNLRLRSKIENIAENNINEYTDVQIDESTNELFKEQKFETNFIPSTSTLEFKLLFPVEPVFDEHIQSYQDFEFECTCFFENILKTKKYKYTAHLKTSIFVYYYNGKYHKNSISRIKNHNVEELPLK